MGNYHSYNKNLLFAHLLLGNLHIERKPKKQKVDFCYKNDNFPKQCAQFTEKGSHFYINGKKKPLSLTIKADSAELTPYLLSLANNKKLKLKTPAILFIGEALQAWATEKPKIGFEFEESGLGIKILEEGTGELPTVGKKVKVHYSGYLDLAQTKKFDSSVDRGQPFSFPLGAGRVIKGWDEGIAKLKIGTKAILWIPSDMGYGARGSGPIPPNSTLFFVVEVLGSGE